MTQILPIKINEKKAKRIDLIDNSSIILMEMTKSLGKKCSEKKKI
jgi:hypothetical protein